MTNANTSAATARSSPAAGLGGTGRYGDSRAAAMAVHGLPEGAGEARARDALRLALSKRDLLINDLAAAERAVQAADHKRWDKQEQVERLEQAERGAQQDAAAEEADLIAAVMEDREMPSAKARPNAEAVERLRKEAEGLQGAANKLKARLPERREAIGLSELSVKGTVRMVVASSGAVEALLSRAEALLAQFIGVRAALAAIVDCLPANGDTASRAAAVLSPVPIFLDHAMADKWRVAIEKLSVDAAAKLPVVEDREARLRTE